MVIIYSTVALIIAFLLDLLLGDPPDWPHIIRLVGSVSLKLEKRLYIYQNKRFAGTLHVILLLLMFLVPTTFALYALWSISPWLFVLLESLLGWQMLATRSLRDESLKVFDALEKDDLESARTAVSMIVGRDTKKLSEAEITRATVETVAENTADGVIAPLFYLFLGGSVFAFMYKIINTMDSMIGYKYERYLDYGRFAAKLDDVVNFLPARLAAWLLIIASILRGLNGRTALAIWKRDRLAHASPNSAQTESVVAGALGIQLGGDSEYFGKVVSKPTIGDATRSIEPEDIRLSHKLLYTSAWLMLALALLFRGILIGTI